MKSALIAAGVLALGLGAPAAGAAAPTVKQLVAFRDGGSVAKTVSTRAVTLKVEGRRCTAGDATPLAALVRSHPGKLRLSDFGACSRRAANGGGLFVKGIRGDVNRGQNGWVYKVGRRSATAGAADPAGPFGNGRLRAGQRVTWFYCRLRNGGCQRTLEVKVRPQAGRLIATVRGYDDEGNGVAVSGATVSAGGTSAETGAGGTATLERPAGRYSVVATTAGLVRSFAERLEVP
jgi:hypothetical protein